MKKALRKEMIKQRRNLDAEVWEQKSQNILKFVMNYHYPKDVKNIMIFMDFRKEVKTKPIIEWLWKQGYQVIIPRVVKDNPILELCVINSFDDMEISSMGILEPKSNHNQFLEANDVDFVFMPGVAFTVNGGRLGYGGGFYDQLIPLMPDNTPLIALAFDLQIVDTLPLEDHDIRIHKLITESGVILCQP